MSLSDSPHNRFGIGTALAVLVALVLVASACNGGERPILTTDRLEQTPAGPTVNPGQEVPSSAPQTASEAVPDPDEQPDIPPTPAADTTESTPAEIGPVQRLTVEILEQYPHDTSAYTQGLEFHDGVLFESTGQNFVSDLRRVEFSSGDVLQAVPTPRDYWAEGLTKVGDEFVQLTYVEQTAFFWDAVTFELKREVTYTGEGWGICYDGTRLIMSNGSADLTFRDPISFEVTGSVAVTLDGTELPNLNELECVNGDVWANVWTTDLIVRIDPLTGAVTGLVDAGTLPRPPEAEVFNGIAWDEATQTWLVTGKHWPTMYRVKFVPIDG